MPPTLPKSCESAMATTGPREDQCTSSLAFVSLQQFAQKKCCKNKRRRSLTSKQDFGKLLPAFAAEDHDLSVILSLVPNSNSIRCLPLDSDASRQGDPALHNLTPQSSQRQLWSSVSGINADNFCICLLYSPSIWYYTRDWLYASDL